MTDSVSEQLASALQQWNQTPNGPQIATNQILQVAASGDPRATTLATWALVSTGRHQEALAYADQATRAGVPWAAQWLGPQLAGHPDPQLRHQALRLQSAAADAGLPVDFFGLSHQLASTGDLSAAAAAIDHLGKPRPSGARAQWDDLVGEVQPQIREIAAAAIGARTERDRVLAEMEKERERVAAARRTVDDVAREVGALASKAGGLALARDYGTRADVIEKRANRFTWASIGIAALVGAIAIALAVDAGQDPNPLKSVLQKAPITIPFLLVNLYVGRLASSFRSEAVQLRHIELQIRTANPFLSALDDGRRKAVLAMLALRFFPGQTLPVPSHTSEPPDVAEALGTLLASHDGVRPISAVTNILNTEPSPSQASAG